MISVIIPTWNEAENLPGSVNALQANGSSFERIVVDGGSTDRTMEVARELGCVTIRSPVRQRAAQLNLGVECSYGDIILFLHADTILPPRGLDRVKSALQNESIGGGAFARKFDSASIFLRVTCAVAELRNRAFGWHLGDQAMFVRKSCFQELGGFRVMPQFEDLDFSRRLSTLARLVTLRPPVVSSTRRFDRDGPALRTLRDFVLTMRYWRETPMR